MHAVNSLHIISSMYSSASLIPRCSIGQRLLQGLLSSQKKLHKARRAWRSPRVPGVMFCWHLCIQITFGEYSRLDKHIRFGIFRTGFCVAPRSWPTKSKSCTAWVSTGCGLCQIKRNSVLLKHLFRSCSPFTILQANSWLQRCKNQSSFSLLTYSMRRSHTSWADYLITGKRKTDAKTQSRLKFLNHKTRLFRCHRNMNCSKTCPKSLNPGKAISSIKFNL